MAFPFHADQIGSLLRPENLLDARVQFESGKINKEALTKIEDEEIKKIVEKQVSSGLKVVSDGEYRRENFWQDFWVGFEGVESKEGNPFILFAKNAMLAMKYSDPIPPEKAHLHGPNQRVVYPYVTGKIKYNPNHPEFRAFEYLKSVTPGGVLPKIVIPTSNYIVAWRDQEKDQFPSPYTSLDEFLTDISVAVRQTILHFYEIGCRVIQIDDPTWFLLSVLAVPDLEGQRTELVRLLDLARRVYVPVLKDLPADLQVGFHTCKGNSNLRIPVPFTYHDLVDTLALLSPSFVSLEYDDERSGDFTPLKKLGEVCPKTVFFLGVVTTKNAVVEDPAAIAKRIEDASKFIPKERLGICPQCGFGTFKEGNPGTNEAAQWGKLTLVADVAKSVWGHA